MIRLTKSRLTLTILLLLAAGAAVMWWLARATDRDMKTELLEQARIAARALDEQNILSLSATEADLEKPAYRRLKSQLSAMRRARPQAKFMYLMGRTADGKISFSSIPCRRGAKTTLRRA